MHFPSPADRHVSQVKRLSLLLLMAPALLALDALAEESRFQIGNHWIQMITPKNWDSANKDINWYSGTTLDETVWLSTCVFDWLTEERLKTWLPKHLESFGINARLDLSTFRSAEGRKGDWNVTAYLVAGATDDGPCEVAVCVYELDEKARFVVTTGGSPANRRKHRQTIEGIMATIKRSTQPTEILK
jgi:hypothetical protein